MKFFKNLTGSAVPKINKCGPALFTQGKCETARTVQNSKGRSPEKFKKNLKDFKIFKNRENLSYPGRYPSIKNQEIFFPQIKIKENQKQQVSFPSGVANLLAK